jgi:hypothetical protein
MNVDKLVAELESIKKSKISLAEAINRLDTTTAAFKEMQTMK